MRESLLAGTWYHQLFEDPFVGVISAGPVMWSGIVHATRLAGAPTASLYLLVVPTWHLPLQIDEYQRIVARAARHYPGVHLTLMTATAEDDALARRLGIESFICNHNAFVDELIYCPQLDIEKIFGGVYVGRLVPFKRHELAVLVPRLAVVTSDWDVEPAYARALLTQYQDLAFSNYDCQAGEQFYLTPDEVCKVVARAHCGLALSAREGAMYASMEYLLSGLPIVTTASVGGRDVFFHPDYVETVDATPDAVATAAARLQVRQIDPIAIRDRVLGRVRDHRARLIEHLSRLVERDLFESANNALWIPQFRNKMRNWVDLT